MKDAAGIDRMLDICALENRTVRRCLENGDITLDAFLDIQAGKVQANCGVKPLRSPDDVKNRAAWMTEALTGRDAAGEVADALTKNAVCTADHHGAIFCAQSFQGDILYSLLLRKLGYGGKHVPVFCASQVELENNAYARGICVHNDPREKRFMPIFPAKYSVTLASHADPVDEEMTGRFRKRFIDAPDPRDNKDAAHLQKALDVILRCSYESGEAKKCDRFADQVTVAGVAISGHLFAGDDGPVFVYLENEEVIKPALYEELKDESSIISRILYDDKTRSLFVNMKAEDGVSFGGLLFRSADEKGRKILLTLTGNGKLTGTDWRREQVVYDTEPDTLIGLMEERKIIPGTFICALISFFERGITWFGGMFQSGYLPVWQKELAGFLRRAGMTKEADVTEAYDCSGYISGPMFDIYRGRDFSTVAGPVEYVLKRRAYGKLAGDMRRITLMDAHRIGLSEMYFDLVARDMREDNWYEIIARELGNLYPNES